MMKTNRPYIAVKLDANDEIEWELASETGLTARDEPLFPVAFEQSDKWIIACDEGILCWFGAFKASEVRPGSCIWLVTTQVFTRNPVRAMRAVRHWFAEYGRRYDPEVWCYVSRESQGRQRFIEALGLVKKSWTLAPNGEAQYIYSRRM